MKYILKIFAVYTVCLLVPASGLSQFSYHISNYTVNETNAGNQNWDITSDDQQRIFVANNYGLLVLVNSSIQLYQFPERNIVRSVAFINGIIFSGSFEDFGYWTEMDNGEFSYESLVPLLEDQNMNNDEIWKIVEHQGKVYFHSFGSIYCYDSERVYRLDIPGSFMFLHKVGDNVLTQRIKSSLYYLYDDEFKSIPGSEFIQNDEVKSFIQLDDDSILIGTSGGIYIYNNQSFRIWNADWINEVINNRINTMIRSDDKIIIGTILNGLYIYDLNGNFIININTQSQLQNNTVLSIFADAVGNLWVGLDKGLDYIAFDTPVDTYREVSTGIGSVYAAALFNDELYIGTNQGIYWFRRNTDGKFFDPNLIKDSQGQVWFIKEIDGFLYSGLNDGTHVIINKELQRISSVDGGYNLKPYPNDDSSTFIQSTYSDLVVYKKTDNILQQTSTIDGFSAPARFLEFDHLGNIWLGHIIRGIYRLQPNIQMDKIDQIKKIGREEGLHLNTNMVFTLANRIVTSASDTLFQWDSIQSKFIPYTNLDSYFTEKGSILSIVPVQNQLFWIIKRNEIIMFEIHFNKIRLIYRILPEMFGFNLVEGYESIIPLNEQLHLICLDDGFAILNLKNIDTPSMAAPAIRIRNITFSNDLEDKKSITIDSRRRDVLPYKNNTVTLTWTASQFVGNRAFFQYKLNPIQPEWSSWSPGTSVDFLRLPSGLYIFSVRSIDNRGQLTETVSYHFNIKNPWYFTQAAFFIYFIFILSFGLMIRFYLSRKRWKKRGQLLEQEHDRMLMEKEIIEKEVIKISNEKLQSEIEHKSSQLATNTIAIIRKNELLNNIKIELQNQKNELGDRFPKKYITRISNLIDRGLQDEREWEDFEKLYDQAHGDFFKRLKHEYPELTPSDLRLCAYLRMNLSSKEIAPLLHISIRGVEERRYRLRKRLNLSADTNLTEMIMTY